jgi:hypothetical protein
MPSTTSPSVSAKVKALLELDRWSTNYQVETTPAEARDFFRCDEAYNEYNPKKVLDLIRKIDERVPPMAFADTGPNWPNPNNGLAHHRYLIGNEGSRVLYLTISPNYFASFRPKPGDRHQTVPTFAALKSTFEQYAKTAKVDEFTASETPNRWTFRFWWD